MSRLRTLHLFAGGGGGLLADMLLGHVPIGAVEIDPYCQQVLSARQKDGSLPWFPIFNDVAEFNGKPWQGLVDVVAGGFPCQDISCAGNGAGIDGERSGLWGEMARIINEVRPQYAFVENSPMLIHRGLARVLSDLAEMGYDARWCVLGACDTGGQHKRERIWIVAHREEIGSVPRIQGMGQRRRISGEFRGVSWEARVYGLHKSPIVGSVDDMATWLDQHCAIGNGQVPTCAAIAWRLLSGLD